MNTWSTLLESAASTRASDSRTLLLLGGTPDLQKSFITQLVSSAQGFYSVRESSPSMVNDFAIGYWHLSIYDKEQEDIIFGLDIYSLSAVYESYASIITSLLQRSNIQLENLFVAVLLDWEEPRGWIRNLSKYIRFIKDLVLQNLEKETVANSLITCAERYQKLASISLSSSPSTVSNTSDFKRPLKSGEYDAPLGVELLVAAMNSEKIDILETQFGRKDDEFDFIQQFMRTVLLKHGASLVYLSSTSKTLFPLLFYVLSPSLTFQHSSNAVLEASRNIEPNVVDRDAILIPAGWDSWNKILLIKDGFDVDGVSKGWAGDVLDRDGDAKSFIEVYEDVAHAFGGAPDGNGDGDDKEPVLKILALDDQTFLKKQLETSSGNIEVT